MDWLLSVLVPDESLCIRAFVCGAELRAQWGVSGAEWDAMLGICVLWVRAPRLPTLVCSQTNRG